MSSNKRSSDETPNAAATKKKKQTPKNVNEGGNVVPSGPSASTPSGPSAPTNKDKAPPKSKAPRKSTGKSDKSKKTRDGAGDGAEDLSDEPSEDGGNTITTRARPGRKSNKGPEITHNDSGLAEMLGTYLRGEGVLTGLSAPDITNLLQARAIGLVAERNQIERQRITHERQSTSASLTAALSNSTSAGAILTATIALLTHTNKPGPAMDRVNAGLDGQLKELENMKANVEREMAANEKEDADQGNNMSKGPAGTDGEGEGDSEEDDDDDDNDD